MSQYSCLENPVDRGVWWATVHGFPQSQTRLKWLSMHACIGEGNGNPLQCSCLENPRDWGAWWAAVYGAAQSRTRLKRLSSSSRSLTFNVIKVAEFWSTILLLSVHFLWSTFLMLSGLFENLFSIPLCFTYWPLLRPYLYFLMITLRIFIYMPILCLFR